jgi:hypothetical protein
MDAHLALWHGDPLPEHLLVHALPPAASTRAAIYAAARDRAETCAQQPQSVAVRVVHVLAHTGWRAAARWTVAAAAVLVLCIWLSRPDATSTPRTRAAIDELVGSALALCDNATLAPLDDASNLDLDEEMFAARLEDVATALAWLETDLRADL